MFRRISANPAALRAVHEVVFHRRHPYRVFSPPRVMGATARLLLKGGIPRGQVLAETKLLVVRDMRRRWLTRRPRYGCRACEGAVVQAPAPNRPIAMAAWPPRG